MSMGGRTTPRLESLGYGFWDSWQKALVFRALHRGLARAVGVSVALDEGAHALGDAAL
jgi:hypothetical protein